MTLIDLYDGVARGGLPFLLIAIGWAGYKRYWVFGYFYDEQKKRADRFEDLAFRSLHIAARVTDVVASDRAKEVRT